MYRKFVIETFGYIVNVKKDKQPTFTCAGVLAFTPFPDDGEIIDINVNADLTKGILIGKGYVYCFPTPGGINHRATSSSVTLQTIGAIPNNQNILKVTWLSSTAT
uniref:Uncharacterized protein n=1 Tax=Panagrolaimus davidi TaxID=227884 RepID=A0A914PFT9_9BILA